MSFATKGETLRCPGGGDEHALRFNGRMFGEGHIWFICDACAHNVYALQLKYGVVVVWEIEPHEADTMEREHMTDPRQILEYLNRGAKRLDRE